MGPGEEAAPGLSPEVARTHELPQQRAGPVLELAQLAEQVLHPTEHLVQADATFEAGLELARALDKTVIEVFEYPGYVVTRAILPFLNEAMHIVMEGVATAENVDLALRLGYDFKIGPLEYTDRVGLDTVLDWMEHLFHELGDFKYRPCPLLRKMVRAGYLGRKAGRGFFTWEGNERVRSAKEAAL